MTESQVMHQNEFSIDSYRLKEINEICRDVKTMFRDWHDFVSESIAFTITWWTDPNSALDNSYEWFPHYTDEMKAEMQKQMKKDDYKKFLEYVKKHNDEYGISMTPHEVSFEDREHSHYRIDSLRLGMINEITDEIDLYPSAESFFDEALDLMITWWKRPNEAIPKFLEMFPHLTEKQKELFKEKHPDTYYDFEAKAQAYHEQKRNQEDKSKETIKQEPITNKITKELERVVINDRKTVVREIIQQPPSLSESYSESEVIARDAEDAVRTLCAQLNDTSSTISELSLEKKITELSDAKIDKDSNIHGKLPYDEYPIIWAFYSRFFPVKVVVSVLADMIADNNGEMVEYDQLREKAYTVALGLSESIKDYEDKWSRKRNVKISAGLQQRPIDERYLSPRKRLEKMNKFNSSKDRFQNHFVGMSEETWNKKQNSKPDQKSIENKKPAKNENGIAYFDGALNAMGLANFVVEKVGEKNDSFQYKIKVGLTPKGAEFYRKRNPVLVNYMDRRGHVDVALFPSESTFIKNDIIPKFSLEEMFVSKIEKELKGKTLGAKEIDSAFVTVVIDWLQKEEEKDVKSPWYSTINGIRSDESLIIPWRVATMGRLSEMGIVNWEIERKTGGSQFSLHIPTEEPPKITTN